MGQCNLFQNHMNDLSLIAQLLHILTWNNSNYQNEQMHLQALQAFLTIKNAFISQPVVAFHSAYHPFALVSIAHVSTCQV